MGHHDRLDVSLGGHFSDVLRRDVLFVHMPKEAIFFCLSLRVPDAVFLEYCNDTLW